MPIPNDTSSESSRRNLFNTGLVGTDTIIVSLLWRYRPRKIGAWGCNTPSIPTMDMSTMENRPRGGDDTPLYTVFGVCTYSTWYNATCQRGRRRLWGHGHALSVGGVGGKARRIFWFKMAHTADVFVPGDLLGAQKRRL